MSRQLSNGSALGILIRRELKVVAAAAFMFLVFPKFHGSPLACLAKHQPCNATPAQYHWLMWTIAILVLWALWVAGSGLPGERKILGGLWWVKK